MNNNKQRHGCLTAFLILMIVANSVIAVFYFFGSSTIQRTVPGIPLWTIIVLGVLAVFNLICAIGLFKWKKWGFWGFIFSSIVTLIVNLTAGLGVGQSLSGLLGVAILYGVLHIGKENKGWPQLD
jgi:hypothetical protein